MIGWPRTLTWNDFTPVPNPGPGRFVAMNGHPIVARVSVAIQFFYGSSPRKPDGCSFKAVDLRVVVNSLEYVPSRLPKGQEAYYLKHEQGHLDLMGLFARELEVALLALRAPLSAHLPQLANAAVDQGVFNAQVFAINQGGFDCMYDRQTNHGMSRGQQERWNARIARNVLRSRHDGFAFSTH